MSAGETGAQPGLSLRVPLECDNGIQPPDLAAIVQGLVWVERESKTLYIIVAIRALDDLAAHLSDPAYRY